MSNDTDMLDGLAMDPIEKLGQRPSKDDVGEAIRQLGDKLADYADAAEAKIRAMGIDPPSRCASCAFTRGTFPNTKAPATGLDALKCLVEHHPFGCHHDKGPDGQPTRLCAGYRMILAAETGPRLKSAPWSFSDELPATAALADRPPAHDTLDRTEGGNANS